MLIVYVVNYLIYGRCNIGIEASMPLLNLCVIELLNLLNSRNIVSCDQMDNGAHAARAVTKTNTMNVFSRIGRQVEVDDECHLLLIDNTSEHLRGEQHNEKH